MIRRMQKTLILLTALLSITLILGGCGSSNSTSANASGQQNNNFLPQAFEMYKKVNLGDNKAAIDGILGSTGKLSDNKYVKNEYFYASSNSDEGGGVDIIYDDKNNVFSKTVSYSSDKVLASVSNKTVTEAMSEQIKKDMPYKQAVNILGSEGVECSRTLVKIPGGTTTSVIWRWGNKDGSCIQIVGNLDGEQKVLDVNFHKAD
jgi:outer membrane protein assembly factor BamE (lipoprotein component of BamABCDE complex)